MKRFIMFLLLLWSMSAAHAQLNNEWIDYSKTYYKFKVGNTGLYRIPYSVIQGAGLSSVPMEYFQLFRNGKEVPLYTSKIKGVPGTTDFIEFYGQQNDGKPDSKFYKQADWQINSTTSLLTDTAAYFLTVNPTGAVLRLNPEQNDLANNTLTPESNFTYTFVKAFKDKFNLGNAFVIGGSYIYSSSYEAGEGWTTRDIYPGSPISEIYNLFPATTSGNASFSISYSGNTVNTRNVEVTVNNNSLFDTALTGFDINNKAISFPHNYLGNSGGGCFCNKK